MSGRLARGPARGETSMRVFFQPLHECPDLGAILRADGWRVEGPPRHGFLAEHPSVTDEEAARGRLDRLGLLNSVRLRIEFLADGRPLTPSAPRPARWTRPP